VRVSKLDSEASAAALHVRPTFRSAVRDAPVRPRKNSVCTRGNLQISNELYTALLAQKNAPTGHVCRGKGLMRHLSGTKKGVNERNVCLCCAEFCDVHHLLRSEGGPVDNLIFGFLASTPSTECCLCLLTKFGLAYFAGSFRRLVTDWRPTFDIFNALPTHTVAAAYSGPVNTTGHSYFLAQQTKR
jgi:hypothetical protein